MDVHGVIERRVELHRSRRAFVCGVVHRGLADAYAMQIRRPTEDMVIREVEQAEDVGCCASGGFHGADDVCGHGLDGGLGLLRDLVDEWEALELHERAELSAAGFEVVHCDVLDLLGGGAGDGVFH